MNIRIFQIDPECEHGAEKLFLSLANLEKHFGKKVDLEIYEEVWSGVVDSQTLEDVYMVFNTDLRPDDYRGRSMSVSDIVEVQLNDCTNLYYCDSIGWKMINHNTMWYDEQSSLLR